MLVRNVLFTAAFVTSLVSAASAVTIFDTHIGSGNPNDVVGPTNIFNITKADVSLSGDKSLLTITIFSDYFSNRGFIGTNPGALFLRTSSGSTVAGSDGASWNYGVRANGVDSAALSGSSSVYSLTSQNSLLLSDSFYNPNLWSDYRRNQEVDVNSASSTLVSSSSSWEILGGNTLSFYIPIASLGGSLILDSNIDFSWSMTCANDIIRGSANFKEVPEPATMLLLGLGALGAARRRAKQADAI